MNIRSLFQLAIPVALSFVFNFTAFSQIDQDIKPVQVLKKQQGAILSLAFRPDGSMFASGADDKTCIIWSYPEMKELKTLAGHTSGVKSVIFTPDLKYLYTAGDKSIKVYQTNGELMKTLPGSVTALWKVTFNKDLYRFAVGSYDKSIRVIDLATAKSLTPLLGHQKNALAVAYSPDSKLLASGSLDESIKIWDASSGTLLKTMTGHGANIYDVVFTNDSKYLISGSADNTARMWDITTGETIKNYPGHEKFVFCVALSPDNAYLLTGSQDATIKLWDVKTGACIYTFIGHKDAINALAFHPSGDAFISGSADNTIMVWKLKPEIFVAHYLSKEYEEEMAKTDLFAPKGNEESKANYKIRNEKAELFKQELINKLYSKYLSEIKGKI
jgi:WD40 repeat protein